MDRMVRRIRERTGSTKGKTEPSVLLNTEGLIGIGIEVEEWHQLGKTREEHTEHFRGRMGEKEKR